MTLCLHHSAADPLPAEGKQEGGGDEVQEKRLQEVSPQTRRGDSNFLQIPEIII